MAKLSVNGTEVARYVRRDNLDPQFDRVRESRTELSVRSNGRVLRKHTAVVVDIYHPKGYRLVTRGWKVWQRFDGGKPPSLEELDAQYIPHGFKRQEEKANG